VVPLFFQLPTAQGRPGRVLVVGQVALEQEQDFHSLLARKWLLQLEQVEQILNHLLTLLQAAVQVHLVHQYPLVAVVVVV
jgi:hypothetical protein